MFIVGIDPGPVVGVAFLRLRNHPVAVSRRTYLDSAEAMQVTPGLLLRVLEALHYTAAPFEAVAYERFVVGPRAARSATPSGGRAAREIIGEIEAWVGRPDRGETEMRPRCLAIARSAAEVKPWATDTRLASAGLLGPTHGMRHARDAARHALFAAVRDYGLPDPLSRKGGDAA